MAKNLKCNCDDGRAFWCPVHFFVKRYLDGKRIFPRPAIHETVSVDELNNGQVGERLVSLRANMTHAENKMWSILRGLGIDFLYQCVIYPYYADFILWDYGMVVELDGSFHNDRDGYDDVRSRYIEELGLDLRRIENQDVSANIVLNHIDGVKKVGKARIKDIIDNHNKKYYLNR